MKKLHAAGAVLLLGCIVLGIISVVLYMGQDHTAPEITIEEADITYTEGEAYTALMEGVTAKDDQDGDLTDQVFVDKVIPTGEDTAMVYYGAIDSAKNVATKGRKIHYIPAADETAAEETAETVQQTEEQQDAEAQEQTGEEQASQTPELTPNGERPVLALNTTAATVAVGTGFDPMSVIQGMVDDKDSVDVLSQKIMVDGTYDTAVPGNYSLSFYVMDSDGNTSDPIAFTLTVQ